MIVSKVALLMVLPLVFMVIVINKSDAAVDRIGLVYKYRIVNWCVVGKAEEELFEWPLLQFAPFLLKTQKFQNLSDYKPEDLDPLLYKNEDGDPITPSPVSDLQLEHKLDFDAISCADDSGTTIVGGIGKKGGGGTTVLNNRVHMKLNITQKGSATFDGIEGLVIQGNHAPFNLGFPFGQFDASNEFDCECDHLFVEPVGCLTRPDVEVIPPSVAMFHYQLRTYQTSVEALAGNKYPKALKEVGRQKEIHFNFKFHNPPCSSAKNVEFWALIVYSFFEKKYEIKKFGPYDFSSPLPNVKVKGPLNFELTKGSTKPWNLNPAFLPSSIYPLCKKPIIPKPSCDPIVTSGCDSTSYTMKCHNTGAYFSSSPVNTSLSSIRLNGEFDSACVSQYSFSEPHRQCLNWTAKFRCGDKKYDEIDKLDKPRGAKAIVDDIYFGNTFCPKCDHEPITTYRPIEVEGPPFFKRTQHGTWMIISLLYLLPISIIIGRFYKETFHDVQFKGWRCWLWMHFIIGVVALLLAYFAYNIPTFWDLDMHMWMGYAALFSGLLGLITGWGRHKTYLTSSFWLHSVFGYTAWGCAALSMWNTTASFDARLVSVISLVFGIVAMIALTYIICVSDRTIGMTPTRVHIPILQIRFEYMYPPAHKLKKISFCVILVLLLIIVLISLIL